MATLITEILLVAGSYFMVFILTILAINWILNGLFKPYMRVRGSRGKLILVKVKNMVNDYYVTGKVDERVLYFKDKKKESRMIVLPSNGATGIYRSMGVSCIDIDDEKNAIIIYNNELVTGYDAVKFSDLNDRCLMKPSLVDNKILIIVVLLVLVLIGEIILGVFLYKNYQSIQQLTMVASKSVEVLVK